MERKIYFILGSLIFLLIFIIYKFKSSREDTSITTSINSPENINDFKRSINKLIKVIDKDRKSNKLLLSEIQKMNKLNKLHTGYLKDVQPKLFNKDIEKHRVYIDTHNIHKSDFNRSDYVYYFDTYNTPDTNITTGYTEIKNVIGFRLVKAVIPNSHYNINEKSNIVTLLLKNPYNFELGDSDSIKTNILILVLKPGYYTTRTLSNAFSYSNGAKYYIKNPDPDPIANPKTNFGTNLDDTNTYYKVNVSTNTYELTVTYNIEKKQFTFQMHGGEKFKFAWLKNTKNSAHDFLGFDKIGTELHYVSGSSGTSGKYDMIIDNKQITQTDESSYDNIQVSERYPNMSTHYLDLIIDEIPYIACKKNALGKKLIERIGLMGNTGDLIEYIQPWDSDNENYFYPISLPKLSIQLYETAHNHLYDDSRDHTLEFEITTIKNPKKFNLI